MEKIINVNKEERYYFDTYKSLKKALEVGKLYKLSYNCSYSIIVTTSNILVSNRYNLYLNKISPLSNGLVFL